MKASQSRIGGVLKSKIVLNTPYHFRKVFYNAKTGRQVAVAAMYAYEPELEMPHLVEWSDVHVSVPVEGMAGWCVEVTGLGDAEKVASRECTFVGKAWNRLILIPLALLKGKLS